MTSTKELFLKRRAIRDQLLAVVKQDWFIESTVYARSELMHSGHVSEEFLKGADAMVATLLTLADDEEPLPSNVCCGICHDIDDPKRKKTETTTNEKA